MATKTYARRNIEAEARAVEAGHHARVQPDGSISVTSDTHGDLGKFYRVESTAGLFDGLLRLRCIPRGAMAYRDDHLDTRPSTVPGVAACMHAALAARRLEREGLAVFGVDGLWRTTLPVHECEFVAGRCECGQPADPFEGIIGRSRG